jgi:hypothetical protein
MPTLQPDNARHLTLAVSHHFKVDPATGRMLDLALLTAGREAAGHGIYIDEKTIETAHAAIQAKGGRLKAYRTHDHGGPATSSRHEGTELDIPGYFSAIAKRPGQLVAGAFEFYDSFKKNYAPQYEQLVEMAIKTPDLIALSVEVWGYGVFVDVDGNEYGQRPEATELLYDGLPALRVTECWAAAFVSDGAANDGLFARLSRAFKRPDAKVPPALKARLQAAVDEWAVIEAHGENADSAPAALHTPGDNKDIATTSPAIEPSPAMKIIQTLKERFSADKAKFNQAMALLGEQPDTTLEALEVRMIEADLSTARGEITALTARLTAAEQAAAALTAERDQYKAKYDEIKASGGTQLNLGAPSAGAAAENPWHKDSLNLTRQIELTQSNPVLAAQLRAIAAK